MVIEITNAKYMGNYKIQLLFSDSKEKLIDFEPFLTHSMNPMTRKFLDIDEFKKFQIQYGDLIWNDYEMCFPIIDLYENNILKGFVESHVA